MKTPIDFMLVFRMPLNPTAPSQNQLVNMHQLWQKFIYDTAQQKKLVQVSRLEMDGAYLSKDKTPVSGLYKENNLAISGYMIVTVHNIDEAIHLAKDCPILDMDGIVELRSLLPIK